MRRLLINAVEGICGNNCVWCYKNKLEPQLLNYGDVASFLDHNSDFEDAMFMSIGENLDHPGFPLMVKMLADHSIKLPQFNTSLLPLRRYLEPEMIEAILHFNNVNIEVGSLTKEGKAINMGQDAMWSFRSNLKNLCIAAKDTPLRINVKTLLNKNNYKDFDEHLDKWKKDFPTVNFFQQSIHVFDENYFKYIIKSRDPAQARKEFIEANFNDEFPFDGHSTPMEYDETRHTFSGAWFIGVDGYLYACQNMAQMRNAEYRMGKIKDVIISDLESTDQFRLITSRMKACCATPLCSKYCPY